MGHGTHEEMGGSDPVEVALDRLAPHWAGYWPGLDVGVESAAVRRRLDDAVSAWGLRDVQGVPWGDVALVASAAQKGAGVVVKVTPRGCSSDAELAGEALALTTWRSSGAAVRLLDQRDGGATLLLERLRPGTMLDETGVGVTERLEVLGALARRLHTAGELPTSLQPMGAFAAPWRRALSGDAAAVVALDALCAPSQDDVVVHVDLHGRNVLRGGDRWVVIDPKGVRGDRHADVWALIDPSVPSLPADPGAARQAAWQRVRTYASAARLDLDRAAAWARLRAHAQALALDTAPNLSPHDAAWAERLHRTADALG